MVLTFMNRQFVIESLRVAIKNVQGWKYMVYSMFGSSFDGFSQELLWFSNSDLAIDPIWHYFIQC